MKETKRAVMSIMVLCFILVGLLTKESAYAAGNSDFIIENGVLIDYQGSGGDVVIPYGVNKIGEMVFFNNQSITGIVIPKGVTNIGNFAFYDCSNLESVVIPDGIRKIGIDSFCGCSSLTNIVLPKGIRVIENSAFSRCSNITNIVLPESVTKIGNYAFADCRKLADIELPKSLTTIGINAFLLTPWLDEKRTERNDHLVIINNILIDASYVKGKIIIPDGVTEIPRETFNWCSDLTDIIIPESVTKIGSLAFYGCSKLTNIKLPKKVAYIGDNAFGNCTNLQEITIPEHVTKLGVAILDNCYALKKIIILNKKVNLFQLNEKLGMDTIVGSTIPEYEVSNLKNPTRTLIISGYKYSTADELAVRINTLQSTGKAFGIKSVKFVPIDNNNTVLDKINVPTSITITNGKSKKLSIKLPSSTKRVDKFTKKQGQVKISVTYTRESLNEWNCFLYDTKKVSNDTIKGTEKGTGYAYTTVTLPNKDKKVFATKVIVK